MSEPRWLDDREMRAWSGFLAASALVNRRLDQQLKDEAGLSHPQYEILVRLAAAPGRELRMTELANGLINSKSGLTYQVTQMEKAGLVRRRSCPSDVRGVFAVLTDKRRQAGRGRTGARGDGPGDPRRRPDPRAARRARRRAGRGRPQAARTGRLSGSGHAAG